MNGVSGSEGSRFVPSTDYYVKLEGAALQGYRSICIAGVRDPQLIREIDDVLARARARVEEGLGSGIPADGYRLMFRRYGQDGVMGDLEPHRIGAAPTELCIVIDVIAKTQEMADTVCALARSVTLHIGYQGRIANSGNLAFPYSPAEFPIPPAYEFRVYHLLRIDDPLSLFPISWHDVRAG